MRPDETIIGYGVIYRLKDPDQDACFGACYPGQPPMTATEARTLVEGAKLPPTAVRAVEVWQFGSEGSREQIQASQLPS